MKTLQVGGLSSSVGRFGSDCITLFLYKLWCLSSTCEVSNTDGRVWGQGCKGIREGDYGDSRTSGGSHWRRKDVFQPWNTNDRSLEMNEEVRFRAGRPSVPPHGGSCYFRISLHLATSG